MSSCIVVTSQTFSRRASSSLPLSAFLLLMHQNIKSVFYTVHILKLNFHWFPCDDPRPHLLWVTARRLMFFFYLQTSGKAEKLAGFFLTPSLVRPDFHSLHLAAPHWRGDGKGPRGPSSWDRQRLSKRKETSAVSYVFAQTWLHLLSGEFPHCAWWIQGGSVVSLVQDGGGSLTAATKTVFLTQGRETSKTGGGRRSRLPSRSLSKCRELYLSEGVIRLSSE